MRGVVTGLIGIGLCCMAMPGLAHEPHDCPAHLADEPAIPGHVYQADIDAGRYTFDELFAIGQELFTASFNTCDGQGRPATTGTGEHRDPVWPRFMRIAAPDANACSDCHSLPRVGGAGGFVTNAFVVAEGPDVNTLSAAARLSNERNPPSLFGVGAIEMLGREMTTELQAQAAALPDGEHVLTSKGVRFAVVKALGEIIEAEGIDRDLVIKPFMQSGIVGSIREFAAGAFNQHFGMQVEERFDRHPAGGPDMDGDGVADELSIGDVTAVSVFLAGLPVPRQERPRDADHRRSVARGEALFSRLGCASCHRPAMRLKERRFSEPNVRNPDGTFADASRAFVFDLTRAPAGPRLRRAPNGGAVVRAYTDLKRHNLCDGEDEPGAIRHFCNEELDQGRPELNGRAGRESFLTKDLWDAGGSAPYGHRGDLTTLAEAILAHGGEARPVRDAFAAGSVSDQAALIVFLKTLRVVDGRHRRDR